MNKASKGEEERKLHLGMRIDYASRLILSSSMAWQVPKDS